MDMIRKVERMRVSAAAYKIILIWELLIIDNLQLY